MFIVCYCFSVLLKSTYLTGYIIYVSVIPLHFCVPHSYNINILSHILGNRKHFPNNIVYNITISICNILDLSNMYRILHPISDGLRDLVKEVETHIARVLLEAVAVVNPVSVRLLFLQIYDFMTLCRDRFKTMPLILGCIH